MKRCGVCGGSMFLQVECIRPGHYVRVWKCLSCGRTDAPPPIAPPPPPDRAEAEIRAITPRPGSRLCPVCWSAQRPKDRLTCSRACAGRQRNQKRAETIRRTRGVAL